MKKTIITVEFKPADEAGKCTTCTRPFVPGDRVYHAVSGPERFDRGNCIRDFVCPDRNQGGQR